MKLVGKVAIITGGGRGIGRVLSLLFAREGASIVISARTRSEIEEVGREVEKLGQKSLAIQADVSKEEDVKRMIGEALKVFKRVDILINNAAINLPDRNVVDLTLAEWNRVFEVNLTGPFLEASDGTLMKIMNIASPFQFSDRVPRKKC